MSAANPEGLTAEQVQWLAQELQRQQVELSGQLDSGAAAGDPVILDQQSVGRLSRMDAIAQQQMALASQAHVRAHLSRVERALAALGDDDFGYCQLCDGPIGWPRLQIRPDSALCVACQERSETCNMS